MTEVIEGTAIEVIEPRAVAVVQQPGQVIVSDNAAPERMVAAAAHLATVLRDIIERQKLYTNIQGKGYPHVEAWQTIGRLDNVVAREARPPIRHDDGAWEAFAELVRLSDGMVIGSASAMCGSPDDEPWGGTPAKNGKAEKGPRPENARRSMAATRAISRAFRGQYAWIMVLAGYQPTPADEMPPDTDSPSQRGSSSPAAATPAPVAGPPPGDGGTALDRITLVGTVRKGDGNGMDLALREAAMGPAIGFKLMDLEWHPKGRKSTGVRAFNALALAVAGNADGFPGQRVTVVGNLVAETFDKADGSKVTYDVLVAESVTGEDFTAAPAAPVEGRKADELDDLAW